MTGWGQDGPLSRAAGHDLNYVALTGLLSLSARKGQMPIVPPSVLGDAAGALGMAFGVACALVDARGNGRGSGRGRVVDAAIIDIVAMMGTLVHWIRANGQIDGTKPSPFHDSPFYDVYACADGGFISLAVVEPAFHALLLSKLGLTDVNPADQYDTTTWPALKERIAALIRSQPRAHWCALLEGSDACFAPVLSLAEAARHPHNAARGIYQTTPPAPSRRPRPHGSRHSTQLLRRPENDQHHPAHPRLPVHHGQRTPAQHHDADPARRAPTGTRRSSTAHPMAAGIATPMPTATRASAAAPMRCARSVSSRATASVCWTGTAGATSSCTGPSPAWARSCCR